MSDASTSGGMSLQLLEVVERARREPEGRFHALAHRIDVPALERAYHRMRKDAAVVSTGLEKVHFQVVRYPRKRVNSPLLDVIQRLAEALEVTITALFQEAVIKR